MLCHSFSLTTDYTSVATCNPLARITSFVANDKSNSEICAALFTKMPYIFCLPEHISEQAVGLYRIQAPVTSLHRSSYLGEDRGEDYIHSFAGGNADLVSSSYIRTLQYICVTSYISSCICKR